MVIIFRCSIKKYIDIYFMTVHHGFVIVHLIIVNIIIFLIDGSERRLICRWGYPLQAKRFFLEV